MELDFLIPGHEAEEFDPRPDINIAVAFDRMLQSVDDRLRCVWVKPSAVNFEHPGRWHVVRFHSNPALTAYWVIEDEHGEYSEPQMRHFEALQAMDTWTGRRVLKDFADARSARKKRQRDAFEDKRREFRERLSDRLDHIMDARISVPRAIVVEQDRQLVDASGQVLRASQGPKKSIASMATKESRA